MLKLLTGKGLKVERIFDIGAHKGRWTKEHRALFSSADFFLFEANQEHLAKLKKQSKNCFIGVLSSNGLPAKFYRKIGTGDSLYRENTAHYSDDSFDMVSTQTLDQLCRDNNIPQPDFIKLDVQGAEIDILNGAVQTLGKCALLLMECPVMNYNLGAPRLQEYLDHMNHLGFSALRITEQHTHEGQLLQVDILFLRDSVRQRLFLNASAVQQA